MSNWYFDETADGILVTKKEEEESLVLGLENDLYSALRAVSSFFVKYDIIHLDNKSEQMLFYNEDFGDSVLDTLNHQKVMFNIPKNGGTN
jgi:hypothetical protein